MIDLYTQDEMLAISNSMDYCRRIYYGGILRTITDKTGRTAFRSKDNYPNMTNDELLGVEEDCRKMGIEPPGSLGGIWRKILPYSVRINDELNKRLLETMGGGWQYYQKGFTPDETTQYDIIKAYFHSASSNLFPDTRHIVRTNVINPHGLYLVTGKPRQPHPYEQIGEYVEDWMRVSEIETHNLHDVEIKDGYIPLRTIDIRPYTDRLIPLSCWKRLARLFWGCWCVSLPTEQEIVIRGTVIKRWPTIAPTNGWWARNVATRVYERVSQAASGVGWNHVYRLFADSILTDKEIQTGENVGDWRIERKYSNRISVITAGQMKQGDLWVKHSGIKEATLIQTQTLSA